MCHELVDHHGMRPRIWCWFRGEKLLLVKVVQLLLEEWMLLVRRHYLQHLSVFLDNVITRLICDFLECIHHPVTLVL